MFHLNYSSVESHYKLRLTVRKSHAQVNDPQPYRCEARIQNQQLREIFTFSQTHFNIAYLPSL